VAAQPYDTMPDGSPVPIVAIFDDDRITLVGAVPSLEAANLLTQLALANSQFPDLPVDSRLTVNPSVPVGVGVRVLELNSVRFPEGSAEILPEHALQFDRVVAIMNALPNISATIVGHADQRGDVATNLVLAQRRADAVVAYLISRGIDGSRLSARSVGEADLLTVDDDEASLALNRRTEFILYGLLVPSPPAEPTTTAAG
jgi:outer membrane protein OmpA-like peptidoglycan-associated protein